MIDITGNVYGDLTAIRRTDRKTKKGDFIWLFACSCGEPVERDTYALRRKGWGYCDACARKKMSKTGTKHGGTSGKKSRLYVIWVGMKRRCFDVKDKAYPAYGGSGITMFDGWKNDFAAFREHVGDHPKDGKRYTIDRIDNEVGYFPNNLRWATNHEQARNKGLRKDNKSGVTGVNYVTAVASSGLYKTFIAHWKVNGDKKTKSFSSLKYGEELAFFMACEYREQMINLLNLQGAGYSENHGKPKVRQE